jgi:hypothetical protein
LLCSSILGAMAPTGFEPSPLLAISRNIGAIAPEINPCVTKGKEPSGAPDHP